MKINWWCGRRVLDGWTNVDAAVNPKAPRPPEIVHTLQFDQAGRVLNPLPLADGVVDQLQALHAVEHVYAWEAPALVAEWRRLLRPGGHLVLELPNLEHAARNMLQGLGDQMCMWPLYGDPSHRDPFMCHRWGYTPATIRALLEGGGFINVQVLPPQTHGPRPNRDMRVEARKP